MGKLMDKGLFHDENKPKKPLAAGWNNLIFIFYE